MVKRRRMFLLLSRQPHAFHLIPKILPATSVKGWAFQSNKIQSYQSMCGYRSTIQKYYPSLFRRYIRQPTLYWQQASIVNLLDTGSTIKIILWSKAIVTASLPLQIAHLCVDLENIRFLTILLLRPNSIESSKPVQLSWCFSSTNM